MKRAPTWDEPMLIHAILSSGEAYCFAIVQENFDPFTIAQLRESMPKVSGLPEWRIARDETSNSSTIEFTVQVRGAAISQNMVSSTGDAIVLKTVLLTAAERLSEQEVSTLADISQYVTVALLADANAIAR